MNHYVNGRLGSLDLPTEAAAGVKASERGSPLSTKLTRLWTSRVHATLLFATLNNLELAMLSGTFSLILTNREKLKKRALILPRVL